VPIKTARHCVGRTARFSFFFFPSHFYTSDIDSTGRTWWPCDMYIPKYRRNLIDDRWILPCKRHSPMMATTSSLPCIDCPSVFAVRGYSTGYTTKLWSLFDSSPIMMTYYWTHKSGRRHGDSTWHIHMCANRPRPSAARLISPSRPPPKKTIKISQNISFSHGIKQIKNQIKKDSRQAQNKTKKNKREMVAWKTFVRSND
jgi:hypothetical protein